MLTAKKCWVKVYEFWIWLPPKIKTLFKDKWWTEYTLNAIPLGWFVRPKWEDLSNNNEIYDKDSFHSKTLFQKILILLWGVIVNLLIAFALFTLAFWQGIRPIFIVPDSTHNFSAQSYLFPTYSFAKKIGYIQSNPQPVKIEWIIKAPGTLSNTLDFKTWDIVKLINNVEVNTDNISKVLKQNLWKQVVITLQRGQEIINLTGYCPSDWCLLWIYFNSDRKIVPIKMNFFQAIKSSIYEIKNEIIFTFEWLKFIFKKITSWQTKQAIESMSGPVWAVAIGKYILELWVWEYVAFIWAISLALAIFNLLPIPALDGWRILTTIIMHLGKFNPKRYLQVENYFNMIFFGLLMLLWLYIMYLDFIRFY